MRFYKPLEINSPGREKRRALRYLAELTESRPYIELKEELKDGLTYAAAFLILGIGAAIVYDKLMREETEIRQEIHNHQEQQRMPERNERQPDSNLEAMARVA